MTEREKLTAWMTEREIDGLLRGEPAPVVPAARYDSAPPQCRPGDVMLFRPQSGRGPVYALILKKLAEGSWLAVPFGRYAEPAVPGEWATGLRAKPLRVLCFWNARHVRGDSFMGSAVKKLSKKQLEEAIAVFEHVKNGAEISGRLKKRLGPRLVHPADPRYEYLDEEREMLDEHMRTVSSDDVISPGDMSSEWLMAAEGRPTWGKRRGG